jgi:hypothetical protein
LEAGSPDEKIMPLKDQIKNYAKKLVENRPDPARLGAMLRPRKALSLIFADDGIIPNNPRFPVIIYRGAVKVSSNRDEWVGPLLARHCL